MDNSNDPTSPNNLNFPTPPVNPPYPPDPLNSAFSPAIPTGSPSAPLPAGPTPFDTNISTPLYSQPEPPKPSSADNWANAPGSPDPWTNPIAPPSSIPPAAPPAPTGWPAPIPPNPQPIPAFTPTPETPLSVNPTSGPADQTPSAAAGSPSDLSPLDNPWGIPSQPPSIDSSASPAVQPSWNTTPVTPPANENPAQAKPDLTPATPNPIESAPTDLSHLISGNNNLETPAVPNADSLTVPSANNIPEVPAMPAQSHKGLPFWLIGMGLGLLLLIAGASAYFILGIGQPPKSTTSLPATVSSGNTAKQTIPAATPFEQPTAQPIASGSSTFNDLPGGGTPSATSAAELLRQRQQQAR